MSSSELKSALLPKKETQALDFLSKHPEYNGKDVLIAIFDSGVDPEAPGLQKTPDGKRKIVDIIDCSGSGDINMKTKVKPNQNNEIIGKTGKTLKIPESWQSSEYRIGSKNLYALFSSALKQRVKKEKKEEEWEEPQKEKLAEALSKLHAFQEKSPTTQEDLETQSNLELSVQLLKNFEKDYKESGYVYDCVMFKDNVGVWKACIDTSEDGDLSKCTLLEPFKLNGQFARLTKRDLLNYSINVYEDGDILSIVVNTSAHGTHVAAIASAYFEDTPELNGVAPGAQIISMQIGNNYLAGMETGASMVRALEEAVANKVDLINMSYGESAKWANNGLFIEMINKIVEEEGIIFVTSAGNNGPALSTVGAPGGTTHNVIGVGAYVTTDMMLSEYSMLEGMPACPYTWTSRGPCTDGALGVCITAPGGAITSVPKDTLSKQKLMNGTSMSSPNACGCLGLVLSGLKAQNIPYSPYSIQRCIQKSAYRISDLDSFSQGQGLIQVANAFELAEKMCTDTYNQFLNFEIDCGNNTRGLYLREKCTQTTTRHNVTVKPCFTKKTDKDLQTNFSIDCQLECNERWVSCPKSLHLNNGARSILVVVDSSNLKPGAHYAEVVGKDADSQCKDTPLFRIPITVVIPQKGETQNFSLEKVTYQPATVKRWFYTVPTGASWLSLSLQSLTQDRDIKYCVHMVQLLPEESFDQNMYERYHTLKPNSDKTDITFKVKAGYTLELCIARWWAVEGVSDISFDLQFHGITPDNSSPCITGPFTHINLTTRLANEDILPKATLTNHIVPLVPKEAIISSLDKRNNLYNIVLKYSFTVPKEGETVSIEALLHSDLLYENKYGSDEWVIYDSNKQPCLYGGSFPVKNRYKEKLKRGNYEVHFKLYHRNVDALEEMKSMTLHLNIHLPTPLCLPLSSQRRDVPTKDSKFACKTLTLNSHCPVYVGALPQDKYPKNAKFGHILKGKIYYSKGRGDDAYSLSLVVPPMKTDSPPKDKLNKTPEEEYKSVEEALKCQWLPKLHGLDLQKEVFDSMDGSLASLNALMNALDESKERDQKYDEIIKQCEEIVSKVDEKELLCYLALKEDLQEGAAKRKVEMGNQKEILTNALYKMGLALADKILSQSSEEQISLEEKSADEKKLLETYRHIQRYTKLTTSKMLLLKVRYGMATKHYAIAMDALSKYFDEHDVTKDYFQTFIQLSTCLQWKHVTRYLKAWLLVKFPDAYEPF